MPPYELKSMSHATAALRRKHQFDRSVHCSLFLVVFVSVGHELSVFLSGRLLAVSILVSFAGQSCAQLSQLSFWESQVG